MTIETGLVDTIAPLLARFEKLDPWYKGFLHAHVQRAVDALDTGMELAETMQAQKRAQAAKAIAPKVRSKSRLRLIAGG